MNVLKSSQFGIDNPMMDLQARTVEFVTHGKSGKLEDRMSGDTIKVVASSAGKAILEIDPGLGKSRIAIECYMALCPTSKVLIVCSKKALNTWRREFPKWTTCSEDEVTIIEGSPAVRRRLWTKPSRVKVITYQSGANDMAYVEKFDPTMIVDDECKIKRGRKVNFKKWLKACRDVKYYIPMDGTLVVNGPQDLWPFLHTLNPKLFSSYWKYVNTFCNVVDGAFGREIAGPKNTKALANVLAPRFVRIKDTDPGIADQRPKLTRDFKLIDMTGEQSQLYRDLAEDMLAITPGGELVVSPSMLAMQVRHRQILICPKILDETMGYGSAIDHLLDNMEDDPHVVVFTPFAKALPHLRAAMVERGYQEPYVLKGGVDSVTVGKVVNGFNGPEGKQRATLCTIAFAESFELWTAKSCHFIGYDWRADLNYQAEKRLHRLITPHPVQSWYYRYRGTVDDRVLERLNERQGNVKVTYQDYITAIRQLKET